MAAPVDIKGVLKPLVLLGLVNAARPAAELGLHGRTKPFDIKDAEAAIADKVAQARPLELPRLAWDNLAGRLLKVDISGDSFDPAAYDKANGPGRAASAIADMREAFESSTFASDQLREGWAIRERMEADPEAFRDPDLTEKEQGLVDLMYEQAKSNLEADGASGMPHWHIVRQDGGLEVIALAISGPQDLEAAGTMIRERSLRGKAVFACGFFEAWGVRSVGEPTGDLEKMMQEHRLDEHPDRHESVFFVVEKPGRRWTRAVPIQRESEEKATIGPLRFSDQYEAGRPTSASWYGPVLPGNIAMRWARKAEKGGKA